VRNFVNPTFSETELSIISTALEDWRGNIGIDKKSPEFEIGAAAILTLFREGNQTLPALLAAISRHRWLSIDAPLLHSAPRMGTVSLKVRHDIDSATS